MSELDENPNCEYTNTSFRLVGDGLRLEVVRERTGLDGFGAEKRQLCRSRRGGAVKQPTGVWYVTTENRLGSTSVERHLLFLLEQLEPVRDQLLALIEEMSLRADFYCYWVSATGEGGPEVSPETVTRIGAMRASLGFEFHGPRGDD